MASGIAEMTLSSGPFRRDDPNSQNLPLAVDPRHKAWEGGLF